VSNYYVIANEAKDQFLLEGGDWGDSIDDAQHFTLDDAVMKQVELIRNDVITEICEVPLMHEAFYEDIDRRVDALQERLASVGCILSTMVGSEDETTWIMEFENAGLTLVVKLTGPDAWEIKNNED
jgi:hypothetical protein